MDEAITDSVVVQLNDSAALGNDHRETQQNTDKNTNPTLMGPVIAVIDVIQ